MLSGTDIQECEIDVISDKEKQGLQYVVGHIFHKFYKKFRSKKTRRVFTVKNYYPYLKSQPKWKKITLRG